ncbi:MAG: phenylacetate--CoA ligase PaaK [Hyphomicrobiaceae bacterium]
MAEKIGLHAIENASRDEISALQTKRLKWSLQHAYDNVARYRQKFDAAGVHPDDFRELADLAKFPTTTKQDLRETYPFGMFAVPRDQVVRIHASSGTTGKPTVVGYTARDIETWSDVMARSIYASGGRPGDIIHNAYGYGLFTGGLGIHYGAEKLGCTTIPISGGQTLRQIQLIEDFEPRIITVTPSYLLNIAEVMQAEGKDPRATSLEIGIFGAEPWSQEMRANIERICGLDAVDIYGLSEVMGPGVASECVEAKDGPVIWEDHFYPEIIDPETDAVMPEGNFGELVFTSLTKEALPIIRYLTRDLTRLLPPTARSMRRFEKITGRSDDMIILRGVNIFPSQFETLLLGDDRLSPHYQLELDKHGALDVLALKVEPSAGASTIDPAGLSAELQETIKQRLGVSIAVWVQEPGTLQRSEGKAVRLVDLRAKP